MATIRSGPFAEGVTEQARLRAVAELRLLDTPPEGEFDEVVQLAAELCGAPVSLLTLLDAERQFHKAAVGIDLRELPSSQGFCRFAVAQQDLYIIPDAAADSRFADNPLVHSGPRVRFYAGMPLLAVGGIAVGALCVLDTVPRQLNEQQERALRVLGRQVSAQLQLRAHVSATETLALELRSERELFHGFLDSMPIEAYLKDNEGNLLFHNRRTAERLARTGDPAELWPPAHAAQLQQQETVVLRSNQPQECYVEQSLPDGGTGMWKVIQTPLCRTTGETFLAGVAIDLTAEVHREAALQRSQAELEEANRKLRSLALTDDLTNLWNRRAFDARLETEVYRAQHDGTALGLLMIDVDDFKQLNDTHGHSHGDAVLQQLAEVLQRLMGQEDMAARFGGEEFAIILPNSPLEQARALCRRLSEHLRQVPWLQRVVTVSIGIAMCLPHSTADELLDMADDAMYRAKRSGKNCAVAYEVEAAMGAGVAAG